MTELQRRFEAGLPDTPARQPVPVEEGTMTGPYGGKGDGEPDGAASPARRRNFNGPAAASGSTRKDIEPCFLHAASYTFMGPYPPDAGVDAEG
jgi:hypothetical protein